MTELDQRTRRASREAVLQARIEQLMEQVKVMQQAPLWRRLCWFKQEQALIAQADAMLDQLCALTGEVRPPPPPPQPMRGIRGPLFWWWMQQVNGVYVVYQLGAALADDSGWRFMLNGVLLYIALHWRVPPYRQAKQGLWRSK